MGPGRWDGRAPGEVELTLITHEARALYEGGVVPVRALARLCGVSLRTLYHHVHAQGWRRRSSSVPRDVAKSERQKARYRERMALLPPRPRGLKARDPAGRQDAESQTRMLTLYARCAILRLRAVRSIRGGGSGGRAKRAG
jgi:hypothetical protein